MSNANSARVAWKVPDWGARYGLGRSKSYAIVRSGKGPRTVEIDGLIRITQEDDEEWRRGLAAQAAERAASEAAQMRAQLGLGPPPEKEAAPATGDREGQLGELLRSENLDETEPPRKITEIDPFAALLWHRLCAAAKARARLVQLRDGDPLGELVANRHTIRIVDVLALRDGERLRQRGRRR